MFNSTILDVAIGLIFVYLLLSLMCSAASEIIELLLKKRAIDLERGIRELLAPGSKSGANDVVQKLYNHSLVNNLFGGRYENSRIVSVKRYVMRTQLPSYIPARSFALALMDLVAAPPETDSVAAAATTPPASGAASATPAYPANFQVTLTPPPAPPLPPGAHGNPLTPLRQAIASTNLFGGETERVRRALIALVDAAGNDVAKARKNIEDWFNNSMDRVSSWYKRRTQVVILILGMFIAAAVNADSIAIVKNLSTDKALRESLVNAAQEYARADAAAAAAAATQGESAAEKYKAAKHQLESLGLPLGWEAQGEKWPGWNISYWGNQLLLHGAGWLLTAFAISLGAPFWFDLLNKFIVIRSAVKPHEKTPEEESKD
ncbi:hypothetical protein BH18ACI4_BH18ACI4_10640 [soil metagenome]